MSAEVPIVEGRAGLDGLVQHYRKIGYNVLLLPLSGIDDTSVPDRMPAGYHSTDHRGGDTTNGGRLKAFDPRVTDSAILSALANNKPGAGGVGSGPNTGYTEAGVVRQDLMSGDPSYLEDAESSVALVGAEGWESDDSQANELGLQPLRFEWPGDDKVALLGIARVRHSDLSMPVRQSDDPASEYPKQTQ